MTLATLQPGARVQDRGTNEFSDNVTVGFVVAVEADADGVSYALVLTDTQPVRKPSGAVRSPHLVIHHQDGRRKNAYEQLGPVARLVRMPMESIDPASLSHFVDHHALWTAARKALFAASVAELPAFRNRQKHHDLVAAYKVLRDAALEKERAS